MSAFQLIWLVPKFNQWQIEKSRRTLATIEGDKIRGQYSIKTLSG